MNSASVTVLLIIMSVLCYIGISVLWGKKGHSRSKKKEKTFEGPGNTEEETKNETEIEREERMPVQESTEEQYIRVNSLWRCPYCETLNDDFSHMCVACGAERREL